MAKAKTRKVIRLDLTEEEAGILYTLLGTKLCGPGVNDGMPLSNICEALLVLYNADGFKRGTVNTSTDNLYIL